MSASRVKLFAALLLFIALSELAIAEVKIMHVTYGKTPSDVYLTIANLGDSPVENLKIFVDGKLVKESAGRLDPMNAIKAYVFIPPGKHEVTILFGNETDSITLNIARSKEEVIKAAKARESEEKGQITTYALLFFVILILIIILRFMRRRWKW